MKAKDLAKYVDNVVEDLKEWDKRAVVIVKKPRLSDAVLKVQLHNIKDDIACGAGVENILRKQYGYGSFEKTYNHNTKEFKATFKPLPEDRTTTSSSRDLYNRPAYSCSPTPGTR